MNDAISLGFLIKIGFVCISTIQSAIKATKGKKDKKKPKKDPIEDESVVDGEGGSKGKAQEREDGTPGMSCIVLIIY